MFEANCCDFVDRIPPSAAGRDVDENRSKGRAAGPANEDTMKRFKSNDAGACGGVLNGTKAFARWPSFPIGGTASPRLSATRGGRPVLH